MTRQYNQIYQCANCGCTTTTETSFGRWIRGNPKLESRNGLAVYDIDYIVHRFKTFEGREYQFIMLIEVKTHNSTMPDAQKDTLFILAQLIENRRTNNAMREGNSNQVVRKKLSNGPLYVHSMVSGKKVRVKCFGVYQLVFSGSGPDDSETIKWNKKSIDTDTLTRLLNFDIDPDTFVDIAESTRNRHKKKKDQLFLIDQVNASDPVFVKESAR
jgi:hypothetical protein